MEMMNPDRFDWESGEWRNTFMYQANEFCTWFFTVECMLKIVAQGFYFAPGTYLKGK